MRKTELFLLIKNRHLTRQAHTSRVNRILKYLAVALTAMISIVIALALFGSGFLYAKITADLPSVEVLPVLLNASDGELLSPSRLLDRSGQVVLFTFQDPGIERKYLYVDPEETNHISPQMLRTITAAMEPDFWESPGYDLRQWNNPEPQTITERLVDELLLDGEPDSQIRRLRMRLLAGQVVAQYGRTRVLEWYLNSAWFGHYAYGVESAAQLYLEKSASDLTLAESALLTPLLESPALNPLDAPDAAIKAQREFLAKLLKNGVINEKEYKAALEEDLNLHEKAVHPSSIAAGFVKQVERQMNNSLGSRRVQRGGVDVITTLDADLQQQFQCTTATQLIRVQSSNISGVAPVQNDCDASLLLPTQSFLNESISGLTAGGLIMDPATGEVLAYQEPLTLDGKTLPDSGYEPGSLLTPFIAAASFARGYSPASLLWDIPSAASPVMTTSDASHVEYHGAVNIRGAVANDYLTPLASLVNNVGAANVWMTASAAGLSSLKNAPYDASPLTSNSETSLFQLAASYGTFANSGVRAGMFDSQTSEIIPNTVLRAETTTGRNLLDNSTPATSSIFSQPLAYLVNHILSDESARWPSMGYPNVLEIGSPVAVKTGSAANGHQVWTVGYTSQHLVLVWMGDDSEASTDSQLNFRMPAGIWHALTRYVMRTETFSGWQMPAGVTSMQVCSPSGMLPTADCPSIVTDVFLLGNEPTIADTLYTRIKVNRETGQRATVFTQPDLVEERVYMDVPAEAREWALQAGIALAPQGYDSIQLTQPDPDAMITEPGLFSVVAGKVKIRGTASGEGFVSYTLQVGAGINPDSWLQIGESGSQAVINDTLAEWDTSGLNGLYAIRLTVVGADNLIKTAITQVTVDNTPPSARITYPQPGQMVEPVRGGVTLAASVEDLVGIDKVEWWVDGKRVSTQNAEPYVYQLLSESGKHKALIKVWDQAGNQVQSTEISFEISD